MDETTTDKLKSVNIHESMKEKLSASKTKFRKFEALKKYLHLKRGKAAKEDVPYGVELCAIMAWTGALVVTAVILRSLYLMYLIPDERC